MNLISSLTCRAALLVVIAMGYVTQVFATDPEQPSFFIETIVVEGLQRASERIIVSESLLEPGNTYDEDELREAVFRIRRLPFVLTADFSLRKGSERGRFQLVVKIVETERFFFGLDLIWREEDYFTDFLDDDDPLDGRIRLTSDTSDLEHYVAAGIRHFVGSHGVLHAALSTGIDGIELGYTHYNLLDRPIVASLVGAYSDDSNEWQVVASLGMHLRRNQSLYLSLARYESRFGLLEQSHEVANLRWLNDSTDDPLFPTRGLRLEAGISYGRSSDDSYRILVDDPPPDEPWEYPVYTLQDTRSEYDGLALRLNGTRFLPLDLRQTLWFGLGLRGAREEGSDRVVEVGSFDFDDTVFEAEIEVGYRFDLYGKRVPHPDSDQIIEVSASLLYGDRSTDRPALQHPRIVTWRKPSNERFAIDAYYAIRNRWGLFRFGFSYLDSLGGDR